MSRAFALARWFRRSDAGTATVEFVIAVPLILAFLFSSIDYGVVMLRQVFLDRAVDLSVRQIRLGNVSGTGSGQGEGSAFANLRTLICDNTFLISDCENAITIELRPIDTSTWAGLDTPAQCWNRAENISPVLAFSQGSGSQELMLMRVCVVTEPFISLNGLVLGMPEAETGGFMLVSQAAFANEPR